MAKANLSARALAMIPARAQSQRFPGKHLKLLGGAPLLSYTIDAARDSEVFDEVVVSSDDPEILDLAETCGASPDQRPASLARNRVAFVDVLKEYLLRPGQRDRYRYVSVLLGTCPLRTAEDIRESARLLEA